RWTPAESRPKFAAAFAFIPLRARPPSNKRYTYSNTSSMPSLDSFTQSIAALAITPVPAPAVNHAPTTSPQEWRDALIANAAAPKNFELLKTLVYKPKTAKTATPIPVVVIARDA